LATRGCSIGGEGNLPPDPADDAIDAAEEISDAEALWPAVEKALKSALTELIKMREREGKNLEKDLRDRVGLMRQGVARVQALAPGVATRYREQLTERIKAATAPSLAAALGASPR
jgi:uncharacterized protein (TIGR00255 family)